MANTPLPSCKSLSADPDVACDECGAYGAFSFGDRRLCADCYAGKGSCCPEFGKDDLWREASSQAPSEHP